MILLEKSLVMYLNQQTQKAQVIYSTPFLNKKNSTLSSQIFSRRVGFVSLEILIGIVGVLILTNMYSPSHSLNTSSTIELSSIKGQAVHKSKALWVSPTKGQVVHDIVRLEASISLAVSDSFKVDHVIFTTWWTGVNPNSWRNICSVSRPNRHNTFQCNGDLRKLQAPTGTLIISFDIYDIHGHVKLAPAGGFTVTHQT